MASKEIILLRERLVDSIIKDCFTFVMVASLCLVGWALQATVLEWVGGFMALLMLLEKSLRSSKRCTMTIPQARARLDEIERESEAERAKRGGV